MALFRSGGLLMLRRTQSVPAALYHKNVRKFNIEESINLIANANARTHCSFVLEIIGAVIAKSIITPYLYEKFDGDSHCR